MNLKVVIHEAEEGGYWAEVPALPGCVTQGETMDELMDMVHDAVQGWLSAAAPPADQDDQSSQVVEITV